MLISEYLPPTESVGVAQNAQPNIDCQGQEIAPEKRRYFGDIFFYYPHDNRYYGYSNPYKGPDPTQEWQEQQGKKRDYGQNKSK